MSIKRNSCRVTERQRMKKLQAKGLSIPQISNAVSVKEHIVDEVLSGRWAAAEKKGKVQQKINNDARSVAKENEAVTQAAAIAAATVTALKAVENAPPAVDTPPAPSEPILTRGQKAAATRKRNKAIRAAEALAAEADEAELDEAAELAQIPA